MSEVFSRHNSARRTPVEYNVISMVRCSRLAEAASNRPTSSRLSTVGSFSGNRGNGRRSEEHTSELQSHVNLVCRLLLEKKKKKQRRPLPTQTKITKIAMV